MPGQVPLWGRQPGAPSAPEAYLAKPLSAWVPGSAGQSWLPWAAWLLQDRPAQLGVLSRASPTWTCQSMGWEETVVSRMGQVLVS